jgi:hypothetical protein
MTTSYAWLSPHLQWWRIPKKAPLKLARRKLHLLSPRKKMIKGRMSSF